MMPDVAGHGLFVRVVPARDGDTHGQPGTWVVPPGAPPPDPSADDEGRV
jgi:hypothetical protein